MFIPLSDYPVQAVNWHDRTAWPGLAEAGKLVPHALMGGVEQYKTLHFESTDEVKAQVRDAIRQMRGRRLIVTTGCTYPLDVPHSNLLAIRQAVER
jgi:uroporphyrinogen decarboxylase